MNKIVHRSGLLTLMAVTLFFTSCGKRCIDGKGELTSEERDPGAYTAVKLQIPAKVIIEEGLKNAFRIEAQPNLLPLINTSMSRGSLVIASDRCIGDNKGITIYITAPSFTKLAIEGSGSIESKNMLNAGELELIVNGSGTVNLQTTASLLYAGIKGSGGITVSGATQKTYLRLDGSGFFKASEFPSVKSEVVINGSGNADIFSIETLKAEINGSGLITYKGNPKINTHINGSGSVTKK
ncbi:MAG: DUF2807 domain-containing protein [Bacteroidetes bacterium]|nr:DUF2807 domain-containing protein [Bacteroidota bacterium]